MQHSAFSAECLLFCLRLFFASRKSFRSLRAAFCKQNCRLFSHFRSACYFAFVLTRYIPFNTQNVTVLGFLFAFGNLRATARPRYARQTPSMPGLTRICVLRELCTQNRCHKCRYSVALLTDCRFYQQNQNRPFAVCFNLNFRTNNALHFYFSKCSATFSSNSVMGRCCGHALSQLLHFMQ